MSPYEQEPVDEAAVAAALRRQADDPDDHDRSLITERLSWSPQQRLEANAAFLRFYLRMRPDGPLIRD
jgi:hypothetical protein